MEKKQDGGEGWKLWPAGRRHIYLCYCISRVDIVQCKVEETESFKSIVRGAMAHAGSRYMTSLVVVAPTWPIARVQSWSRATEYGW